MLKSDPLCDRTEAGKNSRRIDNETGVLNRQMLARVVRLKGILPSLLVTVFAVLFLVQIYRSTIDHNLINRNAQLQTELERLQVQHFHRQQEVRLLETQIERLKSEPNEAIFQARLRLGMIKNGEVVYQFPHGRKLESTLEHRR